MLYYTPIVALLLSLPLPYAYAASPVNDGCTVNSYDEVAHAVANCNSITLRGFIVPAGKTLSMDLKTGTTVKVTGEIKFAVHNWVGPLVEILGNRITFDGNGGYFDGQGGSYWDGKGDDGVVKPKFFKIETTGGSNFNNIKLLNCPHQCVLINSASHTTLTGWIVDVSAGDRLGINTDGFDLSDSNEITIRHAIVKNQDDCVAVNQGSGYLFENLTCSGGHGLSLSVGQSRENGNPNTVKNVTFIDSTVTNSRNGIHIKTHTDAGTGSITDVTYKNIHLSGITNYGINVQEDYANDGSTGHAKGNIPITKLNLHSVTGSMSGESDSIAVYILCGSDGCNNWDWSGISISRAQSSNICNFFPSGFKCF